MNAQDKLRATWGKKESDILLHFPLGISTRSDGHWLSNIFNKEFTDELDRRGYNVTTLKFSIEPKEGGKIFENGSQKFASQR